MKQEASFFEDREAILIYIAKKLRDATRLESVLTEAGVDYGVEADEYRGGVVFTTSVPVALSILRRFLASCGVAAPEAAELVDQLRAVSACRACSAWWITMSAKPAAALGSPPIAPAA